MAGFDTSNLTFSGKEIQGLGEAIQETVFENPDINQFHELVSGVKAKQQIAILGIVDGLTGLGDGGCDPTVDVLDISTSEKFWNPESVSNRFAYCWTELKDTFFIWATKNGLEIANLEGTDYLNFIEERLSTALKEEVLRVAWFSDTTADHSDATGVITPLTNLAYFDKIDGFFKQLFTIVAADPLRLTSGLDSRNGQASYSTQEFDATDTTARVVTNTLQDMRYGADLRFRSMSTLQYIVTQSVYDQYEKELTIANVTFTTERLENGMSMLKSGSITVTAFSFWDRIIRAFEDNGTTYNLPHRAVLLTKDNMQIATEEVGNLSEINVFYEQKDKKNYVDTAYKIDVKIIKDENIQVAY